MREETEDSQGEREADGKIETPTEIKTKRTDRCRESHSDSFRESKMRGAERVPDQDVPRDRERCQPGEKPAAETGRGT